MPGIRTDIVMLAGRHETAWIAYNRLVEEFGPFPVLLDDPVPRSAMLRSRIGRLGLPAVLSQIGFAAAIRPFLRRSARFRIGDICQSCGLERARPLGGHIRAIGSVNGEACRIALAEMAPRVVIVNGTRIIKRNILETGSAVFVNIHQGITPRYRGGHGGYWALYCGDRGNCGVTVHLVDEGIDTGGIVAQARIDPQADDNFATYPYLQLAAALPLLVQAAKDGLAGTLRTAEAEGPSMIWYHPGVFQYLSGRRRGVR